jgi:hypothetical protein
MRQCFVAQVHQKANRSQIRATIDFLINPRLSNQSIVAPFRRNPPAHHFSLYSVAVSRFIQHLCGFKNHAVFPGPDA